MGRYGTTEALVVHLIRSNLCRIHRKSYGNVISPERYFDKDNLSRAPSLLISRCHAHLDIFLSRYELEGLRKGQKQNEYK